MSGVGRRHRYVLVCVDLLVFAIPMTRVNSLLDMAACRDWPGAPVGAVGLVEVEGKAVPVVDLRSALGLTGTGDSEQTRIVVVTPGQDEGSTIGLRTDRVLEEYFLDDGEVVSATERFGRASRVGIAGFGRSGGRLVTVLDVDLLLGTRAGVAA